MTEFAICNHLDAASIFQLRQEDRRVAAIVMARGTLTTARHPSADTTARYPAARAAIAALDHAPPPLLAPAPSIAAPFARNADR